MPELIERGHVYIAQPPLYKVKLGKTERYLKDDAELQQFLIELAAQEAELLPAPDAAPIRDETLLGLLRQWQRAQRIIDRHSALIDPTILQTILNHAIAIDLSNQENAVASAQRLQAVLGDQLRVLAAFDEERDQWSLRIERNEHGLIKRSLLDAELLESGDWQTVMHVAETTATLVQGEGEVRRGEKRQTVRHFADAVAWLMAEVERQIVKQRYKGLGEMNPEQLWETTMDPATRRLLKVQIEDAIAADEIFSTLMGDAVEPRREFIEANALFVRNLDV